MPASAWVPRRAAPRGTTCSPYWTAFLEADALLVGSPIYFGDVTGETRSFFERLWFPGLAYDKARTVKSTKSANPSGWCLP